jgi:hypothetical protein
MVTRFHHRDDAEWIPRFGAPKSAGLSPLEAGQAEAAEAVVALQPANSLVRYIWVNEARIEPSVATMPISKRPPAACRRGLSRRF